MMLLLWKKPSCLKKNTAVEVEVVCIGASKASETIRKALAMGADKATHILTEGNEQYDSGSYARILAKFFEDKEYDVLSLGKQSQDTDAGLTGSMVAEMLNLPIPPTPWDLKPKTANSS